MALCGRNGTSLEKAKADLADLVDDAERIFIMPADIAEPTQVEQFFAAAAQHFGTIDILIANAGIYGTKGAIDKVDWDEWSRAIDINLKGTVYSCRAVFAIYERAWTWKNYCSIRWWCYKANANFKCLCRLRKLVWYVLLKH